MAHPEESPPILTRAWRATLYCVVVFLALLAGYHYNSRPLLPELLEVKKLLPAGLVLGLCFLISLVYVNVYILIPVFEGDARANKFRTKLAAYNIALLIVVFFAAPVGAIIVYDMLYPQLIGWQLMAYILVCLLLPGALYVATLFSKSGRFFNKKDNVREGLFYFRHQLITPAMLLITVPFCCGHVIAKGIDSSQFGFMVLIQVAYALICFTSETAKIPVKIRGNIYPVNLFMVFCLILLFIANVAAFNIYPESKYVVFGVALGLFMAAYEFFGTIYFKETENRIRTTCGHLPEIDLTAKYETYYKSAAWAFTVLTVFFPLTYLYETGLTYTYLVPTIGVLMGVWILWIKTAQPILGDPLKIGYLRKIKGFAIIGPVTIILNSIWPKVEIYSEQTKQTFFAPTLTFFIFLFVFTFVGTREAKAKFDSSFYYWLGGLTMIALNLLVPFFQLSTIQQRLSLSWLYLMAGVVSVLYFGWVEWDVIKPRSIFYKK